MEGYTIKRGVGIGGFGEVYFATSDAGKEVALKRIQRNLDVEIRGVTQCLNLKHPNLISIYDIRYDDLGEGWIVMEYVAGESLKDVIDRNPNGVPLDEISFWFGGIAAGVAYLHDHGIVHRDLKPGNIFRDEGVVKIGDYGLSKFISCSRRSGQTESVGTFHYMAPEIGKGVYGKEIDIYALGIILCEMLTGRVPFEGESSQEIIMKHLTAEPDLRHVPVRFRRVIERALFKDPAKRFSCVSDMLRNLHLDGPVPAPAPSSLDIPPVIPAIAGETPVESREPLYINDEGLVTDEIVFGPVVQVAADKPEKPPIVMRAAPRPRTDCRGRGRRLSARRTLVAYGQSEYSDQVGAGGRGGSRRRSQLAMAHAHGVGPGRSLSGLLRDPQYRGRFTRPAGPAGGRLSALPARC